MKSLIIKLGIAGVILGLIAAALVFKFVWNKPHRDYEKAKAAFTLLAADLFEEYRTDRPKAESTFNGQVVQLNGRLDRIEQSDSMMVGVFVFDQGMFGDEGVRCTMLANHESSLLNLAEGAEVRIKGYVTGFNDTDVILEKCSVVSSQ